MDASSRRVAAACAIPAIVVTLIATAWAGWYAAADREAVSRLAAQATLQASTTEAISALSSEIYALDGLGAVPADAPQELDPYLTASMDLSGGGRTLLELSDRKGARALERLERAGARLQPGTRRALARLSPGDVARAVAGRMPAAASPGDYAEAITDLQAAFASAPATTQEAVDALVRGAESPPPWRRPAFLAAIAGLWLLTAAVSLALGRAVSRRLRRADDDLAAERGRMHELAQRNARLLDLADASRRVSSGTDVAGVADAVAAEAARLLGASAAAVYLVEDARAVPLGVAGDVQPAEIDAAAGMIGRALDTGAPALGVVSSDPALPGMSPVALLAAPLIAGRRITGAIVVGRPADAPLGPDDALELRLIGLAAATAIEGARAHHAAASMALTDALTGVGNRRRLDDDLARACSPDGPRPISLVMIDVDHFKAYNDANGHPAGDEVLRAVAAIAAANVREQDVVYRFGGEELCVILPGAGAEEATVVAERVRRAVAGRDFEGASVLPAGRVTISAGVACETGPEAPGLMVRADAALYRAKGTGRDRVVTAG